MLAIILLAALFLGGPYFALFISVGMTVAVFVFRLPQIRRLPLVGSVIMCLVLVAMSYSVRSVADLVMVRDSIIHKNTVLLLQKLEDPQKKTPEQRAELRRVAQIAWGSENGALHRLYLRCWFAATDRGLFGVAEAYWQIDVINTQLELNNQLWIINNYYDLIDQKYRTSEYEGLSQEEYSRELLDGVNFRRAEKMADKLAHPEPWNL